MAESTSGVGRKFWEGKAGVANSVHSSGDKLFSYGTVLLQRLSNGKVIGNMTKYSPTTSKHQSQVSVYRADYKVTGVPRGVSDLRPYLKRK